MPDVMISYARIDARDFAGRLAAELRSQGIDAWLDTTEIEGGADWLRRIEQAIADSAAVIAVRTPGGRESEWVRRERLYALNARKPVIPVLRLDCPQDLELIERNPIDFRHSFESAFPQLLMQVNQIRDGYKLPLSDRRTLELAYLGRLLLEHSIWKDVYTPMAGVAQLRRGRLVGEKPRIETVPNAIQPRFTQRIRERLVRPVLGETEQRSYDDILPAVEEMGQLVVLGDPGSGKTTTLWRVAVDYAERARVDETAPLPILVRLGELKPGATLDSHIVAGLGDLGEHYAALRNEGRLALLLDGLNELPTEGRGELVAQIRTVAAACQRSGQAMVVTCRALDYGPDLDLRIDQQVAITPLDPTRIRQFIEGYIKSLPEAAETLFWQIAGGETVQGVWNVWKSNGANLELFWTAKSIPGFILQCTTGQQDQIWQDAVHGQHSLIRLARNPYMLFMMLQVYAEEGILPRNRGALFKLFVDFLLLEREGLAETEVSDLKKGLADLAYRLQVLGEVGTSLERVEVLRSLGDEEQLYQAQSVNLLSGHDEIRFTHQLLQEFFAACGLDQRRKAKQSANKYWPVSHWWERSGWEETATLLAGIYDNDCTPVLDWLEAANPEVAAQCVLDSGAYTPPETLARYRDSWLQSLTNIRSESRPRARAALGRALGVLNLDKRLGVGLRPDGIPDIDWVEIPAGSFMIGERNLPIHLSYVFWLARHTVTYSQYAAFVNDPEGGYAIDHYWTAAGLDWRKDRRYPRYWNDPDWHISNHPVVGVTWYEAVAYCRWLTEKLRASGDSLLQLGWEVRLPTEAEWEKAARLPDGRMHLWGDEFDPAKANTSEWPSIGRTSPVGIYATDEAPYGLSDMIGNVWQWCLTKPGWKYTDELEMMDNALDGQDVRTLRGGSWRFNPRIALGVPRVRSNPDFGSDTGGFRLCASAPNWLCSRG